MLFQRSRSRFFELISLLGILVLALFLRFYHLQTNPGWYSDEGSFMSVAAHLTQGDWGYFALSNATLLIGRPPLFFYIAAAVFRLGGIDLVVLRSLTATYGILSVLLVFKLAREAFGTETGLLSAFLLAIYPWAILFNRLAFSYNQLELLVLCSVYSAWKFSERRSIGWGLAASISSALALTTDYLGIIAVSLVLLNFFIFDRGWLLKGSILIVLMVSLIMLPTILGNPSGFVSDISFTLFRVGVPPAVQLINLVLFYGELLRREVWLPLAFIGLCILPAGRPRNIILFTFCTTILVVIRSLPPVDWNYHHFIQLFPFIAMGLASFLVKSVPLAFKLFNSLLDGFFTRIGRIPDRIHVFWPPLRSFLVSGLVFVFVIVPLPWMLVVDIAGTMFGSYIIVSSQPDIFLTPQADIQHVVDYLAAHTSSEDLIIASPQIAWAIPARQADFAQVIAFQGGDAGVLPPLSKDRFEYPCSLRDSVYVVIDPLASDWAPNLIPELQPLLAEVRTWPEDYHSGQLEVYRNPVR